MVVNRLFKPKSCECPDRFPKRAPLCPFGFLLKTINALRAGHVQPKMKTMETKRSQRVRDLGAPRPKLEQIQGERPLQNLLQFVE
jgi:hypothetical protein